MWAQDQVPCVCLRHICPKMNPNFPPHLCTENPAKSGDCLLWQNPDAEEESSRTPQKDCWHWRDRTMCDGKDMKGKGGGSPTVGQFPAGYAQLKVWACVSLSPVHLPHCNAIRNWNLCYSNILPMMNYIILHIFKDPSLRPISYFINAVARDEIPSSLIALLQPSLLLFMKEADNNPNILLFFCRHCLTRRALKSLPLISQT